MALHYVFCEFKGNRALINSWLEFSGAPPRCSILPGLPAVPFYLGSLPWVPFAVSSSGFAGCWRKSNSSCSNQPSRARTDGRLAALPNQPAVGLPPRELAGCSVLQEIPKRGGAPRLLQAGWLSPARALSLLRAAPRQPWALHQPRSPPQLAGGPAPPASELSAATETRLFNSWV